MLIADGGAGLTVIALGIAFYFLPSIIATRRRQTQLGAIAALNLLLGWSVLGWVVALVWALMDDPPGTVATPRKSFGNALYRSPAQMRAEAEAKRASPMPLAERECPHCLSKIPVAASVCRYCQRDIPPDASTTLALGS